MVRISRYLAIIVLIVAVVGIAMGSVFIAQAVEKNSYLREQMAAEKVTLGIPEELAAAGDVVDTAQEAQVAADTIKEHRHSIAPTYNDLLGGGRFDPTNPEQITYMQALNMENYLYVAVLAFGVTTVILATGAFMIATGIALGGTGIALLALSRKTA